MIQVAYMKIQSGDRLLAKRTNSPNAKVHSLPGENVIKISGHNIVFFSSPPVTVNCPLVVERSEAVWTLEEFPLGPAQVVGLDVHGAGVLVLELPLAHRAGHGQVLSSVRIVVLQVDRLELLQLWVRVCSVPLQSPSIVEDLTKLGENVIITNYGSMKYFGRHLVAASHATGKPHILSVLPP